MFKVWQNLAPSSGSLIGGAVEALLTKVVNWQLSVSKIVVLFVAERMILISVPPAESMIPLACAESIILLTGGAKQ
jgi:hypothetical protein